MALIYAFKNIETGKAYIGCTKGNLAKRAREHKCLLRARRHTDKLLQAEWDASEGGFEIVLLETLIEPSLEAKREAELRWMIAYGSACLNQHRISFQPVADAPRKAAAARVANGYRQSPESNLKRRLAQLGKPKGHGAKISATKQAKRAMI